MTNLDSILKSRHYFANKGPSSQNYGFSSSHVWMWELEGWEPKNLCSWTVVLGKTLENTLDCKEIQPVHPKGDQSWVFIGRTDFEAETPILWPPDAKSRLIGKDPDAGKDWGEEGDNIGWDGWMAMDVFEQAPRERTRMPGIHGVTESATTEQLNNNRHVWPTDMLSLVCHI